MGNNEIDFIVRHYRKGCFDTRDGWRRLGFVTSTGWRRYRVAATIAATVLLSATATMMYREFRYDDKRQNTVLSPETSPMTEVVEKI